MSQGWRKLHIAVLLGVLIGGCTAGTKPSRSTPAPTITLDRSIHFTALDGSDIEVPAGTYQVESPGELRLRLTSTARGAPLLIQAQPTTHTESLESPVALTVATDEDRTHLVLLMPDKTALDAPGSLTGIRSRADLSQPLTAFQLHQAAGMTIQRVTPGVAPIAVHPSEGTVITGPGVRFKWFPGSGQPAHARWEICVTELNQPCSLPTAVVVKVPAGIVLTEPSLPKQSAPLGPRPGDPDFEPPVGTAGPSPYGYGVTLPLQFQGKRLQWSVMACVPSAGATGYARQPLENCTSSLPRLITWVLQPPTLNAPADNAALSNLGPGFSWTNGNQQGVEYFLVCIAKPNVPCPVQPGVQPHVFVALVQNALGFTPPKDLAPFMGHTLHWTVAACNAALGCVYQQQYRRFHVPIVDGSFDSIYEVTQNAKCKNCHNMHLGNENYRRHIELGRFTRDDFISPLPNCRTCHTSTTGFADGWRAPHQFGFDEPMDAYFCRALLVDRSSSVLNPVPPPKDHLMHDGLILWAVDHMPGVGRARWQQKVEAWFQGGTPCPCEVRGGGFTGPYSCQVHGQFTKPPFYDMAITAIGPTLRGTSGGALLDVTVRNNGDLVTAVNVQCGLDRGVQFPRIVFPTTVFQIPGFEFGVSRTLTIATATPLSEIPSGPRSVSCTAWIESPPGVSEGNYFADNDVRSKVSK